MRHETFAMLYSLDAIRPLFHARSCFENMEGKMEGVCGRWVGAVEALMHDPGDWLLLPIQEGEGVCGGWPVTEGGLQV